jgi:hypothetical protein
LQGDEPNEKMKSFDKYKKTPEEKRFYSSAVWTQASRHFRSLHPLCEECSAIGKTVPSALVHHNPPLIELLKNNLNPVDPRYLHAICFRCHQGHLRSGKTAEKPAVKYTPGSVLYGILFNR